MYEYLLFLHFSLFKLSSAHILISFLLITLKCYTMDNNIKQNSIANDWNHMMANQVKKVFCIPKQLYSSYDDKNTFCKQGMGHSTSCVVIKQSSSLQSQLVVSNRFWTILHVKCKQTVLKQYHYASLFQPRLICVNV